MMPELVAAAAADRADDHEPGVDADARPAALAEARLDRRDDRARGVDAAVGVVGQRLGRAEDAEQPVAEELCARPPCASSTGTTTPKNSFSSATASRAVARSAKA